MSAGKQILLHSCKLCVIGGSEEYTGAPYFAAIASLHVGSDLVHVYCHPAAATPIKCYSPDLIVHPLFKEKDGWTDTAKESLLGQMIRFDCIILGPGCGLTDAMQNVIQTVIDFSRLHKIFLICDADVFRVRSEIFMTLKDHPCCILTPNVNEFDKIETILKESAQSTFRNNNDRLSIMELQSSAEIFSKESSSLIERAAAQSTFRNSNYRLFIMELQSSAEIFRKESSSLIERAAALTRQLNIDGVLLKHQNDIITDGKNAMVVNVIGSNRRCGGQGDLLAGALGSTIGFLMTKRRILKEAASRRDYIKIAQRDGPSVLLSEEFLAAALASLALRKSAKNAEDLNTGYISASDISKQLGPTYRQMSNGHF